MQNTTGNNNGANQPPYPANPDLKQQNSYNNSFHTHQQHLPLANTQDQQRRNPQFNEPLYLQSRFTQDSRKASFASSTNQMMANPRNTMIPSTTSGLSVSGAAPQHQLTVGVHEQFQEQVHINIDGRPRDRQPNLRSESDLSMGVNIGTQRHDRGTLLTPNTENPPSMNLQDNAGQRGLVDPRNQVNVPIPQESSEDIRKREELNEQRKEVNQKRQGYTMYHQNIVQRASENLQYAQEQINMCDALRNSIEKYFVCLDSLQDEVQMVLSDWVTPQHLARKQRDNLYHKAMELDKNKLSYMYESYLQSFRDKQIEIDRTQDELCRNIGQQYNYQNKIVKELQNFDMQVPLFDEKIKDMANMIEPPLTYQERQTAASEVHSMTAEKGKQVQKSEYQNQMRAAAQQKFDNGTHYGSTNFLDILSGESQLTTAMRVPDLITGSPDKFNREIFRDCQQYYQDCKDAHMQDILACNGCLTKQYLPMKCRQPSKNNCYSEVQKFLNNFKNKINNTALRFYESLPQPRRNAPNQLEENFKVLQELRYKLQVGSRSIDGIILRLYIKEKLQLCVRVHKRWGVNAFSIGSAEEGTKLTPEGKSSHSIYEYLTNQIQKIYKIYESISDFPLGLLIILIYFLSIAIFEGECQSCYRLLDFSGSGFGLMVPQFRDLWIRPDFRTIYKHNLCQTSRDFENAWAQPNQ